MDCPELVLEGTEGDGSAFWECGIVTQVCTNPDGQAIQVHRDVGTPAPSELHLCDDHTWKCYGKTSWAYLAIGMQCGTVTNECGETVQLPDCQKTNDVCSEHVCVCTPTAFPSDYNCGWTGDGCGSKIIFGDPTVAELQLSCDGAACMKQFNDIDGYWISDLLENSKYPDLPDVAGQLTGGTFEVSDLCTGCGTMIEGWLKAPDTAEFSFMSSQSYEARVWAATKPESMKDDDMQEALTTSSWSWTTGPTKFSWVKDEHYYVKAAVQSPWSQDIQIGLHQEDGGLEWKPMPLTMFEVPKGLCPTPGGVCDAHRCCSPLTAANFSTNRSCGHASDGCGGLVLFGSMNGECPTLQTCNETTYQCIQGDTTLVLFAITDKSKCAEGLPYGPERLTDSSTDAYVSNADKDLEHSRWLQVVRPFGTPDASVDFSIVYDFPDVKTLKDRFTSLTASGELVNYTVQAANGDEFHINGRFYFSDGAWNVANKMDSSGDDRFAWDDGAWGAGGGEAASRRRRVQVNGNGIMPTDFWGVGNWNGGDSKCSTIYMNGAAFSGSGQETDVKSFIYMEV